MLITSDFEVAAPVDKVWRFFDDIPQVASCLPGTELTGQLGDNKYQGQVAVRMGPVKLQFAAPPRSPSGTRPPSGRSSTPSAPKRVAAARPV